MEEEKSHAMEMGKEKKKAHEETTEETRGRAVEIPTGFINCSSFLSFFRRQKNE
jgi:hypothetical protein